MSYKIYGCGEFCIKCGARANEIDGFCRECFEEIIQKEILRGLAKGSRTGADYGIERYYQRKSKGICVACNDNTARPGRVHCEACAEKAKVYASNNKRALTCEQKARQSKREKARREELKKLGICAQCKKSPAENGKTMCADCLLKLRIYDGTRREALALRGMCVSCGRVKAEHGYKQCRECRLKKRRNVQDDE